jgi:hypothetical protein
MQYIIVYSIAAYLFITAVYAEYLHIIVFNHTRGIYCIVRGFFWWAFFIKKTYVTVREVLRDLS